MKKFMKIYMCFMVIAALCASANAAAASRTTFEIGFDFVVRDESFPAGKYSVERLSAANPEILVLKLVGGKARSVLLIRQPGELKSEYQLSLHFRDSGDKIVLVGVRAFGTKYALDAAREEKRRESRNRAESLSFIRSSDIFGAE